VHACDPSIQEDEAEASQVQGHPGLHSKFQPNLDYTVRPYLNKIKQITPNICTYNKNKNNENTNS
jgi:hypothetical protein